MKALLTFLLILAMIPVLAAIFALPTWLTWNWVAVDVLGLKTITFLQAWGINVLTGVLFRGSLPSKGESK